MAVKEPQDAPLANPQPPQGQIVKICPLRARPISWAVREGPQYRLLDIAANLSCTAGLQTETGGQPLPLRQAP